MARLAIIAVLAVAVTIPVSRVRAGVYSPDEPTPFPVRADGTAEDLGFGTQSAGPFRQLYAQRMNEADPNPNRKNTDRQKVLERIATRTVKPNPTPADSAALAADLIRVGRADDALNLLAPLSRSRVPDFRVMANLTHAHVVRGEWGAAVDRHQSALLDTEFPDDLPGTTPEQRKWLQKVERQYYSRWLQVHRQRAAAKLPPDREEVFPLFDVRFVNDAGRYEPGNLAAAEKAKLPPDAVAVVQQLLLWAPWDAGLYWLLGELYAAEGRMREAKIVFDACAEGRQYSNRPTFMAHRTAVRDAEARLPPEKSADELPLLADEPPADPSKPAGDFLPSRDKLIVVGAVFGAIVLVLLALQFRAIGRRLRGWCGPTG